MDFELTEDQLELQRLVRDVAERECPPSLLRQVVEKSDAVDGTADADLWATYVSLDWPSLTVPEADGGMGFTAVELAIVLDELGRVADPTPFLATTSQYAPLVRECAGDELRRELLGAVCVGGTGAAAFAAETVSAEPDGEGWILGGTARYVVDGNRADQIAVVATTPDGVGMFVVPGADAGATRSNTLDGSFHVAHLALDGLAVPADRATVGPAVALGVARAHEEALVGIAAITVGASQRTFEIALEHIKERHQFGVPIGSFQALKHMAVDVYIAIERARALTQYAALAIAEDDDRRSVAASMAKAAAGDAQRIAVQHGIQFFGGLGYTWENDLQLYAKRAKVGELVFGSAASHRAKVARSVLQDLGEHGGDPVKLAFDDDIEALRQEFSAWLDENAPDPAVTAERPTSSAHIPAWARPWQQKLFDAGYLVPGNPPEYGGRNASLIEQFVYLEEMGRRRIAVSFNPQGLSIITPSILAYGTEEQKQRWALPILRAEMTAALGMSEPDAGSDLAGLRTRAVRVASKGGADRFVVNGQKVWTSGAQDADVIFTFVRTDPDAPKHKGISVLLIPTDSPGLTRRPFGSIIRPDEMDFNEVFFDDVEVPAENLVGPLNDGWTVANGSLGHERAMLWLLFAERIDAIIEHGGPAIVEHDLDDDRVLDWYGKLAVDRQALRLLGYRALGAARRGQEAKEQSILKLLGSEAAQEGCLAMLETLGPDALDRTKRTGPPTPLSGDHNIESWWDLYLRTFSGTIAGGTSQIQRNIVAERILGLPR